MKKTLRIDERIPRKAKSAYDRLRALRGKMPKAADVPRRPDPGTAKKHAAP